MNTCVFGCGFIKRDYEMFKWRAMLKPPSACIISSPTDEAPRIIYNAIHSILKILFKASVILGKVKNASSLTAVSIKSNLKLVLTFFHSLLKFLNS